MQQFQTCCNAGLSPWTYTQRGTEVLQISWLAHFKKLFRSARVNDVSFYDSVKVRYSLIVLEVTLKLRSVSGSGNRHPIPAVRVPAVAMIR